MPYELSFSKVVAVADDSHYINPCCHGGDVVSDQLLPAIQSRYADVDAAQEDWGWFIWFRAGEVSLSVDIFCDDRETGEFRIHLTSRKKRRWFSQPVVDTDELEQLKNLVIAQLSSWTGAPVGINRLNEKYL